MKKNFTSRKFLLAVSGILFGIAVSFGVDGSDIKTIAGAVTSVVSVVAYLMTEGKIDAEAVKKSVEATQQAVETVKGE